MNSNTQNKLHEVQTQWFPPPWRTQSLTSISTRLDGKSHHNILSIRHTALPTCLTLSSLVSPCALLFHSLYDSLRPKWLPLCILAICFLQVHALAIFYYSFARHLCWTRLQTSSFIVGVVAQTQHAQLQCPPNCDFLREQKSLLAPKPNDTWWQAPTAGTHHWKRTKRETNSPEGPINSNRA